MKLSENLSLKEVVKSNTASRLGIDNTPEDWEIENLKAVAENIFQPIRDHFGVPEALDLDADVFGRITNADIFNFVKDNLVWDQMIWEFGDDEEPNWVHISYKSVGQNRKQIKRARRDKNNKVYYTVENA